MKVRELLEINQNIVDVYIEVRNYPNNGQILDALYIGMDAGVEPPHPFEWGISTARHGKAKYIRKSINAFDDGRDYWEIKVNRIPDSFLNLDVYSWHMRSVYKPHHPRDDRTYSMEAIQITTYKPDAVLVIDKDIKRISDDLDENGQLKGQMSFI